MFEYTMIGPGYRKELEHLICYLGCVSELDLRICVATVLDSLEVYES